MKTFLTDPGKQALTDAIRSIEARSSAEVVVAVRPSSGGYAHAIYLPACLAAFGALALLLFSPWPFALGWILLDPVLVGLLTAWLFSRSRWLRRALTRDAVLARRVEEAAAAAFLEKKIHQTRWRTGLLVFISLLERRAVVVSDLGVEAAVPAEAWGEAVAVIDGVVRRGGDAEQAAAAIEGLGEILSLTLERTDDDINELADEVCVP